MTQCEKCSKETDSIANLDDAIVCSDCYANARCDAVGGVE